MKPFADRTVNVRYFDMTDPVRSGSRCDPLDADGNALYFDETHLSLPGSVWLGIALRQGPGIPDAFREVVQRPYDTEINDGGVGPSPK